MNTIYHSLQIIPDDQSIFKMVPEGSSVIETKDMNGINTWDDWHLIPSSRPLVSVPKFKSNYIDIPGANGSIDASTILGGYPTYNDREGSIEFYVMNDYGEWYNRYSDAMEYLHGKTMKMILEDEPSYYYTGRMTVNQWKSDKGYSKITLDYHFDPFKMEVRDTFEEWLWDPFSFVDGVIRTRFIPVNPSTGVLGEPVVGPLSGITLSDNGTYGRRIQIPIHAMSMPIVPVITAKANSTPGTGNSLHLMKYHGNVKVVDEYITPDDQIAHDYSFYKLRFQNENSLLVIEAPSGKSFTVSVHYRGGRL